MAVIKRKRTILAAGRISYLTRNEMNGEIEFSLYKDDVMVTVTLSHEELNQITKFHRREGE